MIRRLVLAVTASAAAVSAVPAMPVAAYAYAESTPPLTPAQAEAPPPVRADDAGDRLTVTFRDAGSGADRTDGADGADGTYELRCHPAGGSHPGAAEACATLDRRTTWGKDPFAPVAPGTMCTMTYGGPATAHVSGTWAGRPVDARFHRADGCQIARWDALVPLLPDTRS
ncbi:SSI family serine proteinase inhibitor [Streptomyces sp. SD15]